MSGGKAVGENWITTGEAVELTGYHPEYLRDLLRRGEILAEKVGRSWLVNRDALLEYRDRTGFEKGEGGDNA